MRRRAIFTLAAVAAALLFAEAALRAAGIPAPEPPAFRLNPLASPNLYEPDPRRFWRLVPGGEEDGELVNVDGFRGDRVPVKRRDGVPRIILAGDSVVYGFRLPDEQTIGAHLSRELSARGEVEVLNAGVVGYSSLQTRRYLEGLMPKYRPDAVIVYVGWNDWSDAARVPDSRLPAPSPLRWRIDRIGARSRIYALLRAIAKPAPVPHERPGAPVPRVYRAEYEANLRAIDRLARENGAAAYFAKPVAVDNGCVAAGAYTPPKSLAVIDVPAIFDGACGARASSLFPDGAHPSPRAALMIANRFADALKKEPQTEPRPSRSG
ncbi:SGNH/GDSL hydrolase family protein [bacterium]|nr:SGNH/GDSL hydrolase family protein [bacterium]